jgi:hypothetical protein
VTDQLDSADPENSSSKRNKAVRERRKRLTEQQHRLIAEYLDSTKEHKCAHEDSTCKGGLVLDHIDGDPNNNHLANFQWLCRSHNRRKTKSLVNKLVSVRSGIEGLQIDPTDNLVLVSERQQACLTNWLLKRIGPGGPHKYLTIRHVEQEAGFDCHMSPVTIHRHLVNPGPLCASNAPFRLVELHRRGDRPGRSTKCIMWNGNRLDPGDSVQE